MKNLYIFMGPPGSGKGSLSALCTKRLGWAHLSTGGLCRSHIERKTSVGLAIEQVIREGRLIDDTLITDMVLEWIAEVSQTTDNIILDGFPRTPAQAEALQAFIEAQTDHFSVHVVTLELSDQTVVGRIKDRVICENSQCQAIYSRPLLSHNGSSTLVCRECKSPLRQRADDRDGLIYERLATYHKHARAIALFYEKNGARRVALNAEAALDHVYAGFVERLTLASIV